LVTDASSPRKRGSMLTEKQWIPSPLSRGLKAAGMTTMGGRATICAPTSSQGGVGVRAP
jgi:hypothetical protein